MYGSHESDSELCRRMSIRLLASYTLRNLSLRVPGVPAESYGGYMLPALVLAAWLNAPGILVEAEHDKFNRVGQSNGFLTYGAGDVHPTRCHFSYSLRNAVNGWCVAYRYSTIRIVPPL